MRNKAALASADVFQVTALPPVDGNIAWSLMVHHLREWCDANLSSSGVRIEVLPEERDNDIKAVIELSLTVRTIVAGELATARVTFEVDPTVPLKAQMVKAQSFFRRCATDEDAALWSMRQAAKEAKA